MVSADLSSPPCRRVSIPSVFAPQAGRDGAGTNPIGPGVPRAGEITAWRDGAGTDAIGPGVPRAGEITAWDRSRTTVARPSSCFAGTKFYGDRPRAGDEDFGTEPFCTEVSTATNCVEMLEFTHFMRVEVRFTQ